ncbi:AMP-binding protein [Treponema endosymbiont of Eucomonympha sp.]|uniref:AMP-binding protein n=2 Tax=Treponema endosymbiont of Eucomonympha sp. TaxID=1580831 RepID=UPI000783E6D6|nr:AMP-binding protein [Treponema endosymbiont of Eucomonympha sp.]
MLMNDYVSVADAFGSYEQLRKSFAIRVPERFNFAFDVADRYAETEPDRRALVWCDDAGGERTFTFADLRRESNRTARFLQSLGVRKGDAVMLVLRRRYEFWFFLLALHKIGAIAVPATNMLHASDIVYRTNAAGIKVIVSLDDPVLQKEVDAALPGSPTLRHCVTVGAKRAGWVSFAECAAPPDTFPRPSGADAIRNEDIMLLYFTSGTSGEPKMVQHNFTYPLGHIATAKYWQNVTDGGLHLTVAETGWAKAVWGKIYGQWLAGSAVFAYDMESFVPNKLLEKIARYRVTTFCAPPTVYRYLIKLDLGKYDLSSLAYCTTAGEALNPEVSNRFTEMTGRLIYEGYGQTETTLVVGTFTGMKQKPGSMGKPAPGYDIDIINADGTSCAVGEEGEIVLRLERGRPFGMFAGYYRDEALGEQAFRNNVYHTGDVAFRDDDGYFWFSGRTDDMIKSAGFRISPFEVESALQQHPAVLECAVTGVYDPQRGQIVKATVVPAPGYEPNPALGRELQDFVKRTTAQYKYPRIVEFVEELPKTVSGKIRRSSIREQDEQAAGE